MEVSSTLIASLISLSQNEKDFLKAKSCILPIDPSSDIYSGEKLVAILKMIECHFKRCTIAICPPFWNNSTTQSHEHTQHADYLYEVSKWKEQNNEIVKNFLKIPHTIDIWNDWLTSHQFEDRISKVESLYESNAKYRNIIDAKSKERKVPAKAILERCALKLLWLNDKYDYILCMKDRDEAIINTFDLIEKRRSKVFLSHVIMELNTRHTSPDLEVDPVILESITQSNSGNIYWKDKNGVYLGCNEAQARSSGKENTASIIGKSDFDLLSHEDAIQIRKNDLEVMYSGETKIIEEVITLGDIKHCFISHKTPLRNKVGNIIGVIGISWNATKEKQLLHTINPSENDYFYHASLSNISEDEKNFLKAKKCIIMVSVGNVSYNGEKLNAILKMVNKYFKECVIAVCDVLQRHTLAITYTGEEQDLYNLSKQLGSQWIEENIEKIKNSLKIPYRILRWENWFCTERFNQDHKTVRLLYNTNLEYKAAVDITVESFVKRYIALSPNTDAHKASECSLKYILEECACMLQWFDEEYEYEIYPSARIPALAKTYDLLEPIRSSKFLCQGIVKFEKRKENIHSNFDKITLDSIISTSPGHMYWKDKTGVYRGCNTRQAQHFGLVDINKVIGRSDFDLLDYEQALKIRENDIKVMKSGKTYVVEEIAKFLGKTSVFLSHKTPLKDENEAVVGILGISLDITAHKEAEHQLHEKNKQLIKALEAKRAFFNNISHEIRTPISNILRMSQMLYEDWEKYPNNEARKAHLKIAVEGNDRLQNVLANLLDFSQAETGRIQYNMQKYSLKKSIEDVISEFVEHKHRIHTNLDNVATEIICDHFRIEQVIRNLLANAITYGGPGDITVSLISYEEGYVMFTIMDQGLGVPEEELEEIFKPFKQSTRTQGKGGNGIGLAISKTIIEDHKGVIWAQNNKDCTGSQFSFKLKMNDGAESEKLQLNRELEEGIKRNPHLRKPTLLIIDDDMAILQVSELVFDRIGFEVITASSGRGGFEILQNKPYKIDLVLLDMMMPDLHGLEVLKKIKAHTALYKITVYIHSGISNQEQLNEATQLGAEGSIDKTSSIEEIEEILSRFLSKSF